MTASSIQAISAHCANLAHRLCHLGTLSGRWRVSGQPRTFAPCRWRIGIPWSGAEAEWTNPLLRNGSLVAAQPPHVHAEFPGPFRKAGRASRLPPAFGQFLLNSLAEANPQGCQKVAGGRPGQRGNDHRETAFESEHPGGGARTSETGCQQPRDGGTALDLTRKPHSKYLGSISETHGWRVPAQIVGATPISRRLPSDEAGTPAGVQNIPCPVARRSPAPERTRRPPATLGQPFGVNDPGWRAGPGPAGTPPETR
jgi:hypothetical protein